MKKYVFVLTAFLITLVGCNNTPKSISYGSEGCHFCSMTIVDKQHAALFMTKKGRTYSFDAIECMLNYLKEIDKNDVATFLVNDYQTPGELIEANIATYLISKNMPSPMGEYLSAFGVKENAQDAQEQHSGDLLTWSELQSKFEAR